MQVLRGCSGGALWCSWGLWRVYLRFFGFGVLWSGCRLFPSELEGLWMISTGFAGGL